MLRVDHVSKRFGSQAVLDGVGLTIAPGEIHGLLGLNGSGKTTLLNILSGNPVIRQSGGYSGKLWIGDRAYHPLSPAGAAAAGIGMVRQESALIAELSVADNIRLSREATVSWTRRIAGKHLAYVDGARQHTDVARSFRALQIDIDPQERVRNLSIGQKHFVELVREMERPGLKFLLLDEPTSAMNRDDTRKLFKILRELSGKSVGIVFVSHKIEEVLSLCSAVTILRDGKIAGVMEAGRASPEKIYETMTRQKPVKVLPKARASCREPVIGLNGFSAFTAMESVQDIRLDIFRGEIMGLTSLTGHGRQALVQGMMGLCRTTGALSINGCRIEKITPDRMIAQGVAFIPEDRHAAGLLLNQSITDNMAFPAFQSRKRFVCKFPLSLIRMFDGRAAARYAEECIGNYHIRCESASQKAATLSGGNQQKVCIAGAVATRPAILIVSEPTRGIDISAKELILNLFLRIRETEATAIVVASGELDELKRICDRIVVLQEGRIRAVLPPSASDPEFARHLC